MKITGKRIVALILALVMAFIVTACENMDTPSGGDTNIPHPSQATAPTPPPSQTAANTTAAPQKEEAALAIAQRAEREFAFRVTIPDLAECEGTDNNGRFSIVFDSGFGDRYFIAINPFEPYDDRLHSGPSNGTAFEIIGNVEPEQGVVWGLVYVPESSPFDWAALDVFEVEVPSAQHYNVKTFNKADIEKPMEEVSEEIALLSDMTEFRIDRSAISLKVKDNGDGTLTFTYRDSAMEPAYLYPWSWLEKETVSAMYFECWVGGKFDYNPDNPNTAIESNFGFHRDVGRYNLEINTWDTMTVDMTDTLMGKDTLIDPNKPIELAKPVGIVLEIDENGLTATWTTKFKDGYSLDDVAAFQVILQYDVWVLGHGEGGLAFLQTRFTAEEDEIQSFGFEVADVLE